MACSTILHSQGLKTNFNCQSELLPVTVKVKDNKGIIELTAGGQKMTFKGSLWKLESTTELKSEWIIDESNLTTFSLSVIADANTLLKKVKWFEGLWNSDIEQVIQSTPLMDNVIFLRKKGVSIFISLDFPFSQINSNGINYPPNKHLARGESYDAHTLTIGACKLSGLKVGKFDRAEIEAFSAYIEKRSKPRFNRPLTVYAGIINRMTNVRDGRVFYSMFDNPTISLSPKLVEEDLVLCSEVGIEYYQAFEGVFDWPDEKETSIKYKKLLKQAGNLGVRVGDYVSPQGLYCPHYNYSHREVGRPDWLIVDKDGHSSGPECLAVKDYYTILFDRLIQHNSEYNLQLICLDFLNIKPCYATNHGHEPGDVYQQILALVNLMEELNKLDPNYQVWSNSGNWIDLMPKLTWYNQNVYLTDPHIRDYAPHLNTLKMFGDGRREQMVSVHESHFVPYRNFTNFEYYLVPKGRVSDTRFLEYSFLQGLCVTPNIGFGELRTLLERIPAIDGEQFKEFINHWLQFVRDNYDVWKQTKRIGDLPGVGAAEVYGHIKKDRGFLCLVNQNAFPTKTAITIDNSIGLDNGDNFLLNEIYPLEAPISEQSLPFAKWGDTINFIQEPNSVRILEISPSKKPDFPVVYGLPSEITSIENGYNVIFRLPQGKKKDIGLVLPQDETIDSLIFDQVPTVNMYTFPVSAKIKNKRDNLARIQVQAPRELAPKNLNHWRVGPDKKEVELPTSDLSGFMGAYVHNAFSEDYELNLQIITKQNKHISYSRLSEDTKTPIRRSVLPAEGKITYSTNFILPFIEGYGLDRGIGNDAVIELVFDDPGKVHKIEVRLNHNNVPVMRYRNPRQPLFETFYVELTGNVRPGYLSLELDVTYK